jgi:hypothetical protein
VALRADPKQIYEEALPARAHKTVGGPNRAIATAHGRPQRCCVLDALLGKLPCVANDAAGAEVHTCQPEISAVECTQAPAQPPNVSAIDSSL